MNTETPTAPFEPTMVGRFNYMGTTYQVLMDEHVDDDSVKTPTLVRIDDEQIYTIDELNSAERAYRSRRWCQTGDQREHACPVSPYGFYGTTAEAWVVAGMPSPYEVKGNPHANLNNCDLVPYIRGQVASYTDALKEIGVVSQGHGFKMNTLRAWKKWWLDRWDKNETTFRAGPPGMRSDLRHSFPCEEADTVKGLYI